jgi:AbrB family looped-hinge helix DNA binding protein
LRIIAQGPTVQPIYIDLKLVQPLETTVKVSPKFQVVIPEPVRGQLGLKAGSRVEVIANGGIAYLVPLRTIEENQVALDRLAEDAAVKPPSA